jgi:hypothetical protein
VTVRTGLMFPKEIAREHSHNGASGKQLASDKALYGIKFIK